MKLKKGFWVVRKSTYHKLKNLLSKLSRKENLTLEEERQLKAILKGETEEVRLGSSEGSEQSEQIEDDLSVLRNTLKDEQVARADAYEKLTETEQKLKEAEENQ